ncbi:hypothetical protein [Nonomuraea salmonea]|uniref:non-homologous end-joining DNA ligase LigD n=1 Tax=Nonomuraea salmonea TaxID=46181 RepID=UPI003CD0C219
MFVDFNQNAYDRTVASAYSVRAVEDARVSTPLTWDEVPECHPEAYTIETVPARLAERGDPWEDIDLHPGSLDGLLELAEELGPAPKAPKGTGGQAADQAADRDRQGRAQGRGDGRVRAVEGPPSRGRGPARARRRAGRRHAGAQQRVVPHPGQPAARPRGRAAPAGAARGRLRPLAPLRLARLTAGGQGPRRERVGRSAAQGPGMSPSAAQGPGRERHEAERLGPRLVSGRR